jgi:protein-L-isoaspartate(D-aspartate) O-methyltransferase
MNRPLLLLLLLICLPLLLGWEDSAAEKKSRMRMVASQIEARGVRDERVLAAMRRVPRHLFVPPALRSRAYADTPLPIGEDQTISQPYIVALMTAALELEPEDKVLEIGTGSGYQAAVLAELVKRVYTVEIKERLSSRSDALLKELGYENVTARRADGYFGWEEHAPFDAIMITAAVYAVPPPLLAQLSDGGRMILPMGNPFTYQELVLITRRGDTATVRHISSVRFVPMTGEALERFQAF